MLLAFSINVTTTNTSVLGGRATAKQVEVGRSLFKQYSAKYVRVADCLLWHLQQMPH